MAYVPGTASSWSETVIIPTYGVGMPDKNPMFLEKRVYQGSSGKVYPLPVIDRIEDEKADRAYTGVWLENDWLRVLVLPELGGRIQRALDKTNGYDFVYYNEVIKPALVGLLGPWISGGIEFNWPQHHRPTTFMPVDWHLGSNADGSAYVMLSETDRMYGTRSTVTFTLYPDKAFIEVRARLYNGTDLPQTFLWWANPAVAVNDDTQSVFPPDVTAVYDHGKRDVSAFPIARGVYYKHDYSPGTDISRYKNIPVPTSYMAAHSDYDFVGNYDYGKEAGLLHVADHHVSPGKKQWTWGCGDFGRAWDRNLTDANGPYIELMTGMFCDNQPDFSWLEPFEEKTFSQYFMPYKGAGSVKNACRALALNLEQADGCARVSVYASERILGARIVLSAGEDVLLSEIRDLPPAGCFRQEIPYEGPYEDLRLAVYQNGGRELLSWQPEPRGQEAVPDPMPPLKEPAAIGSNEELWLAGRHLEQYRHATRLPDPYYLEALRRDPGDVRANVVYGRLLLRRLCFKDAESYFRAAAERLTKMNPNPEEGAAHIGLGLSLLYQGRNDEAYDAFYKAVWTADGKEQGYYCLACIDGCRGEYGRALDHIEQALVRNAGNVKARALKGLFLDALSCAEEAEKTFEENVGKDPFDCVSLIEGGCLPEALRVLGNKPESYLLTAADYARAGFYEKAVFVLECCPAPTPLVWYHIARYAGLLGDPVYAAQAFGNAAEASPYLCFPNTAEDALALMNALRRSPADARAPYYLGCLRYDRLQYDDAVSLWELSARRDPSFPTVWRNLSLAYFNKKGLREKALDCMKQAYALDPSDARVLLELDALLRKMNRTPDGRLSNLEAHLDTVFKRDDLTVEYCTLLNDAGRYKEALRIIEGRHFHPWEGGEGKVTTQYMYALLGLAVRAMNEGDPARARELLLHALNFPENLGEGKLEGEKDNHLHYWLGLAERALGNEEAAALHLRLAAAGDEEPGSAMFYNDQPADMIWYEGMASRALALSERARDRFLKLTAYCEKHLDDDVKIDFFAVSLPDLQLFDDDLNLRNRVHCHYLEALGFMGLGETRKAREAFEKVLSLDHCHQGALFHRQFLNG